MSIASEIARLQTAKANLKTSIENKGVTVSASATLDDYPAYVDAINGEEPPVDYWIYDSETNPTAERNEINFYDYDGTLRYSYSKAAFSTLPPFPSHTGLVGTTWNMNSTRINSAYNLYGYVDCGINYTTTDGSTWLFIETARKNQSIQMSFSSLSSNQTIEWGDGETTTTSSSVLGYWHTYNKRGKYVIKLKSNSSSAKYDMARDGIFHSIPLSESSVVDPKFEGNELVLKKVFCGSNLGILSLTNCLNLEYIAMNEDIFAVASMLMNCRSLKAVCYHNNGQALGTATYLCYRCDSLEILPGYQRRFAQEYDFYKNTKLGTYGVGFTPTAIGSHAFYYCLSLKNIVFPTTCTSIGNSAFEQCSGLESIRALRTSPPTLGTNVFSGVDFAKCTIYVPNGSLSAYQSATNWSSYASYMVEE